MKSLVLRLLLFVPLLAVSPIAALATSTDELTLTSGSSSITVNDTAGNGSVSYSNFNFNGWDILISFGSSNTPGLQPYGLDLTSLTATCESGGCATQSLTVEYSDINFSTPVPVDGFSTTFSNAQSGNGTATESAYSSNLNTLGATTSLIGTITESGSGEDTVVGGTVAAVDPYSLTLEQVFTGGSGVSYSADGDITLTPEPASMLLIGTGLLAIGFVLRRRLHHT